ncbi:MAG TPA: hypothetical protein VIF62_17810 [Labilithrix sp.]
MRRLPTPPPLPRFDDDDDLQPTTVAPWRTAVALARFDEPPKSSDRESGIRELLENALSVDVEFEREATEKEPYDPGCTVTLVRPEPVAKTTYSFIGIRQGGEVVELAPRLEKPTVPEREDEALGALVALYEERPTSLPPPPPEPSAAPKPIPRSQVATVRKKTTRVPRMQLALEILRPIVVQVVERWLSLDLRYRLAILAAWTATCSAITALLVR